jgi:2-polyprenyl-3-methyl-5-hydroxy-6-metoxy-1,4-benzoquinol methylase
VIALGFAAGRAARGLADELGRSRWNRLLPEAWLVEGRDAVAEWPGAGLLVREQSALPGASSADALRAFFRGPGPAVGVPRDNRASSAERLWDAPRVHTLREFEEATGGAVGTESAFFGGIEDAPAVAYRNLSREATSGRTPEKLLAECLSGQVPRRLLDGFQIFRFSDTFGDRPELRTRIPGTTRSLLDVGCGAGQTGAAIRRDHPGLRVTGIEIDSRLAARAREALDRVLTGDAAETLRALLLEPERFDVILMGDMLEHTVDPRVLLERAAGLLGEEGRLIASVPNVAHVSVVRDLLLARFDYLAAGLCDAGHLRFFTPGSLRQMLEREGWTIVEEERLPGAPAPEGTRFLEELCAAGLAFDRGVLETYQTVVTARR